MYVFDKYANVNEQRVVILRQTLQSQTDKLIQNLMKHVDHCLSLVFYLDNYWVVFYKSRTRTLKTFGLRIIHFVLDHATQI